MKKLKNPVAVLIAAILALIVVAALLVFWQQHTDLIHMSGETSTTFDIHQWDLPEGATLPYLVLFPWVFWLIIYFNLYITGIKKCVVPAGHGKFASLNMLACNAMFLAHFQAHYDGDLEGMLFLAIAFCVCYFLVRLHVPDPNAELDRAGVNTVGLVAASTIAGLTLVPALPRVIVLGFAAYVFVLFLTDAFYAVKCLIKGLRYTPA